jgi:hypothetical protein
MASDPAGRADKLGNEFERLWAVRHLIELVSGRAMSVKIEALGDDERGTEFWVDRPDGTREAHQCKRENGTTGRWSVADLEAKRVITNAQVQLGGDPRHRFIFASGDKVTHLSDLAERSHRCDNPAEFVEFLATTSRGHAREFNNLCQRLGLDPVRPQDSAKALDFLRRFRPQVVDKNSLRDEVEELASRWVSGEPRDVVAALKDLVDESIGRTLREADVVARLPAGSRPRDLAKDPSLVVTLHDLRGRFDRSYRHLLISGSPLGRSETDDLLARLTSEGGPRLVLLHGTGGDGKSGVVFELVGRLGQLGIPCLPLRLDRDRPDGSPLEFGRSLGLPGSPAGSLAAAVTAGIGVLILDQVDALRWTAAHSSYAWDCCECTIAEALRHPQLRVVVVCRSFDVEDDPRIRAWKQQAEAVGIRIGSLDDAAVDVVVAAGGVMPSSLGPGQRRVLRSPQGLYLWRCLHDGDERPPAFRTMTDLMRSFWTMVRRELKKLRPGPYEDVLDSLVSHMDRRGTLSTPRTVVGRWPDEVDALLSMNVLVEGPENRLLFAHQSYLDHRTAERVLQGIHSGEGSVLGWLSEDDQGLFRRGQMRQVLALLRDDDPRRYIESIREILDGEAVRFHLQQLSLQMLGLSEAPSNDEVDLVLGLLERPEWSEHAFFQVVAGREAWFDALHERGALRRWLEDGDERRVNLAISIIERVVGTRGIVIEALLFDRGRERWPGRLDQAIWRYSPASLSDGLFDAVVAATRRGASSVRVLVDWKELAKTSAGRCLRLLEARVGRDLDLAEAIEGGREEAAGNPFDREDSSIIVGLPALVGAARQRPVEAWDLLLPCYRRLGRLSATLRRRSRSAVWNDQAFDLDRLVRHEGRVIGAVVTAAGRAMAETRPESFWDRLASASSSTNSITRLLARCIPSGPDEWADYAIRWLLEAGSRIRCRRGDPGAAYHPACRILRRYAGCCADDLFADLQAAILEHRPKAERDSYRFYHDRNRREAFWGDRRFDVLQCNKLGLGQHLLLSAVPKRRLTLAARSWAGVLRRKFGPIKPLLKRRARSVGGRVGSTIPGDRLVHLSDRDWLRIIRGDWSRRPRRWKQMGPDQLGEVGVETFAGDLRRMAGLQPARFARLALAFPLNCDSRYPEAVLHALGESNSPNSSVEEDDREQADVTQVEAILRRFSGLESDREFASAACRIVGQHPELDWGDATMALICRLAIGHPDPLPGHFSIGGDDSPDVVQSAINCVRGSAAGAIEALLFDRPGRIESLRPAIEALLDDPHPAVRVAATGVTLPLLNLDRDSAIEALLRACSHADDRVLGSFDLARFLRYTVLDHPDKLKPLIGRMVSSRIGEVAKAGACWAAIAWSYRGGMGDVVESCVTGNRWQRMGVAEAITNAVLNGRGEGLVVDRLRDLFGDSDEGVRDAASEIFRDSSFFDRSFAVELVEAFIQSPALDGDVAGLLRGLEEFTKPLRPYAPVLCRLADRFTGPLAAEAHDYRTSRPIDAGLLAKVLLRLYEQSESDRTLRRLCLDSWDRLLRQGLGYDVLRDADGHSV